MDTRTETRTEGATMVSMENRKRACQAVILHCGGDADYAYDMLAMWRGFVSTGGVLSTTVDTSPWAVAHSLEADLAWCNGNVTRDEFKIDAMLQLLREEF